MLPISTYPSRQSGHQQHRGFPTYFCYNLSLELIAPLSLASQREVALNIYRCRVSDQLDGATSVLSNANIPDPFSWLAVQGGEYCAIDQVTVIMAT